MQNKLLLFYEQHSTLKLMNRGSIDLHAECSAARMKAVSPLSRCYILEFMQSAIHFNLRLPEFFSPLCVNHMCVSGSFTTKRKRQRVEACGAREGKMKKHKSCIRM